MNDNKVVISIIIPTHNRKDSLKRALDAISYQSFPLEKLEVIIVADGCTDNTMEMLHSYAASFDLFVIEQNGQGAAVARNQGAAKGRGKILLFLDDDIEALPQLVENHVSVHQQASNRVGIGYLPPVLKSQKGFFRASLREWWEHMFIAMNQPGYRFNYRNLLSGNFSVTAELFNHIGGFNTDFKCQEDYELGLRLIQVGADFTFVAKAIGYHHEVTDLNRSLVRKFEEGKAVILFSRKYPEVIYTLPLLSHFVRGYPTYYRNVLKLIFKWPSLADVFARSGRHGLNVLEYFRLRNYWQKLLDHLLAYWYLQGVAEAAGSLSTLTALLQNNTGTPKENESVLELDIMEGLESAEQKIDEFRPTSLKITYGKYFIGQVDHKNGYERLRGSHLRLLLAKDFAYNLLQIMTFVKLTDATNKLNLEDQINKTENKAYFQQV